ncbi:MAG: hypothetical protein M3169_08165 [Candidatus Eremiobacteraeota bacterium]|nr:hypothetical protein [Candidatus Eremiobacteraeota bacterium]
MPTDPQNPEHAQALHFVRPGFGMLSGLYSQPQPQPVPLDRVEQNWIDTLERERAKIPRLEDAFHAGRPATPAEIGAVVIHAQQIENWFAGFLTVAQDLAAHGHTRLLQRINTYLADIREARAIYQKMQQDAGASQNATGAIMTASNQDTLKRLEAMHDARQAVFDEMNAQWTKTFNG